MKFILWFFLLTCSFVSLQSSRLDVLIKHQVVEKGEVDCLPRYREIAEFLEQYERPFSFLDLGAKEGYYSIKVAEDFCDAAAIMIEKSQEAFPCGGTVADLCRKNRHLENLIYLDTKLTIPDIVRLSECEHFDVAFVSAPSSYIDLDHPTSLSLFLQSSAGLADYVFIELPVSGQPENLLKNAKKVATLSHPDTALYLIENKKGYKSRKHWYAKTTLCEIFSTFSRLRIYAPKPSGTVYRGFTPMPGINLVTFKVLGGAWPSSTFLYENIKWAPWDDYEYIAPSDFTIGGHRTYLHTDSPLKVKKSESSAKNVAFSLLKAKTRREVADILRKQWRGK